MRVAILLVSVVAAAMLLLLLPAPAVAAPAEFALTGGIPLRLSGAADLESEAGILLLGSTPQGLSFDSVRSGRVVTIRSEYLPVPDGSLVRVTRSVTETPQPVDGLAFTAAGPDYFLAAAGTKIRLSSTAEPAQPEDVWTESNVQLSLLLHDRLVAPPMAAATNDLVAEPLAGAGAFRIPRGEHEARADRATAQLKLERMVVFDALIEDATGTLQTGREVASRPGTVYSATGWTGPGEHFEETVRVLVVEGGTLSVGGERLTLYTDDLLVHLDGLAQFAWAEGQIETGGETRRVSDAALLGGDFELRALAADLDLAPSVSWLGTGDVDVLQIGSVPASTASTALVTVAAGGAALGALALLYYWPAIKYASTLLVVPLYARLPRDRVLDHTGRELVYARIRHEPGISAHRLADVVNFGWSTLAYHLRVLERSELIVSVRDGRYRRFFDRESGRYANGRKHLVAVLKNDQTLAIARAVLDAPGSTQKALAERFGLSPSSVHWHVQRLEAARLLTRTRDGHHVRYHPGASWSEIDPADVGLPPAAPPVLPHGPLPSVADGPAPS